MQSEQLLQFGPYRFDPRNGQLWRGKQEVRLTPKAAAVLRYLVERAGQVATKEELFAAVWPDTVVSDAALTSCIQELRQALRDDARKPRYIETLHKRGFRFVEKVVSSQHSGVSSQYPVVSSEEEDNNTDQAEGIRLEAAGPPLVSPSSLQPEALSLSPSSALIPQDLPSSAPRRSWLREARLLVSALLLAGIGVTGWYLSPSSLSTQHSVLGTEQAPQALALPDKPSIIVLPFQNLSGDPGQDYFSDGLTEVLTGDLSQISSLFVIARNSAFTYKGKAVKIQDVGREMGVRYVLEGSVLKADGQVRITTQLIDATTGYHVWSQRYDRPLKDIFALHDDIVQKIVTTLELQLTLQEQGFLVHKHTENLEAYDAFLHGLEDFWRTTKEANAQARQMVEKAVALDPQYAGAYALLSQTYLLEWIWRWSADPQTLEQALVLAKQAAALDDSLPGAHSSLSWVYASKHQFDQAIAAGERAIALDPNHADSYAWQADALNHAGRPEEALRAVKQAMRLHPRYPSLYLFELGWAYNSAGQYSEAIATLKELISRSPDFLAAYLHLAGSYLGQWISQLDKEPQTLGQALAAVQRALALNGSYHWSQIHLSSIYLHQQQYEQALVEIERGVALAPTEASTYATLAVVLGCIGRMEDALKAAAQALRLTSEVADSHLAGIGSTYASAGRYEEAIALLKQFTAHYPNFLVAHLTLAAAYGELGRDAEARAEAAEVLRLNPNFSLEVHKQRAPIKDPTVLERHVAALRKAGLK